MTMAAARPDPTAEDEILGLLASWADATRAKDVDAIMATLAPDVVAFDCHGRLRFEGAAAFRQHLKACLPCVQGPMTLELHDLAVTAQGEVGFCHYLARCGATGPDGAEHLSWFRGTAGFRRINGSWQIAHAHLSAPFDPATGQAALGLEP